jgi:hypothetical protein
VAADTTREREANIGCVVDAAQSCLNAQLTQPRRQNGCNFVWQVVARSLLGQRDMNQNIFYVIGVVVVIGVVLRYVL